MATETTAPPAAPPTGAEFVTRAEMRELLDKLSQIQTSLTPPAAAAAPAEPKAAPKRMDAPRRVITAGKARPAANAEGGGDGGDGSPPAADPAPAAPAALADIVCGKEGTVKIGASVLPEITKWSFKPDVSLQEYASNKTNGYKRKVCGSKSATGSLEGKWDRDEPITTHFVEGDSVTLLLYIDATRYISTAAIIKSLSIDVDINENAITGWSCDFEADGEWEYNF